MTPKHQEEKDEKTLSIRPSRAGNQLCFANPSEGFSRHPPRLNGARRCERSSQSFSSSSSSSSSTCGRGVASILWTVVREVCCPGGTQRTLSRRDWMIVVRQFIAWNTPKKGEPSRRDGVSRATRHIHRPWSKNVLSTQSYRSLRDGPCSTSVPGTSYLATFV